MGQICVGTSGFSYDDWRGFFYPEGTKKSDMLRYYAGKFSSVEVNASYYAIPSPASFARMAENTPESFAFAVKAHKDLTHSEHADPETFKRFISAIDPLVQAGKLGCILVQYPWSFKKQDSNIARVRQLKLEFGDLPVVVEFRNAGWVGNDTFGLLRENQLGFCCVDEPKLNGLMPGIAVATSPIGYVRFHGRNAGKWWNHDAAWERYNYLYSAAELGEWVPKVRRIQPITRGTHQGDFMGIPATDKRVEVSNYDFVRFENDQAAEHWGVIDSAALMEQLGMAPAGN
jgi:uncharacterized protein YecE (DUF72 family)